MLANQNLGPTDHPHDHVEGTDHSRLHVSPTLIVAAVIAVVLAAFVLANTATTDINFLFTTATAPVWVVLTVVILVSFSAGLLLGSFGKRH